MIAALEHVPVMNKGHSAFYELCTSNVEAIRLQGYCLLILLRNQRVLELRVAGPSLFSCEPREASVQIMQAGSGFQILYGLND